VVVDVDVDVDVDVGGTALPTSPLVRTASQSSREKTNS